MIMIGIIKGMAAILIYDKDGKRIKTINMKWRLPARYEDKYFSFISRIACGQLVDMT